MLNTLNEEIHNLHETNENVENTICFKFLSYKSIINAVRNLL